MGLSENISSGGVFIASECPPSLGEEVQLVVGPEARPIQVNGVVRWLRVDEDGNPTGCGVQFIRLDDARKTGKIGSGDLVTLVGSGVGANLAGVALRTA